MKSITIFVDESGTLPDPKDKVIVVVAAGVYSPEKIDKIIKTVRKRGRFRKATGEIKFYTVGAKSKNLFFKNVVEERFDIFILIIEKMGRIIQDSPLNFAVFSGLLLKEVFARSAQIKEIIFDRHFHKDKDIEEFNQNLGTFLKMDLPKIKHVDSQKDRRVNVADMIAGAVLAKERGKKDFYDMFKARIVSEIRLNWPEAKRKYFGK